MRSTDYQRVLDIDYANIAGLARHRGDLAEAPGRAASS